MSKITNAFTAGKAFIPFITCGDPNLETTERVVLAMAEAGADIIELGIPFSDPTAEGPVIQAASERALENGTTTDDIFDMVRRLREKISTPLVFMTYANVVFSYGTERFLSICEKLDVNGLILPDVPYEEKDEFFDCCTAHKVDMISLIAPTSHDRIRMIAKDAVGFVYCVSSMGVTGVRSEIKTDLGEMVRLVKETNPDIPCAIGFGISTPEQAYQMTRIADGAIVGSAIVRIVAEQGENAVEAVREYVSAMKQACLRG